MMILVHVLISVAIITLIEHYLHKYHMHRKGWVNRLSPSFFGNHQKIHHPAYRYDFEQSDPEHHSHVGLRLDFWPTFKIIGIPLLIVAFFFPVFALVFSLTTMVHHYLWNEMHTEMHIPRGRYFRNWWFYKKWREHHLMHHFHPNRNFNVVCIWGDYMLGTKYKP